MHTGDLGYYDENGCIFVVDRIKEILKVKGHHVAPVEIEEHLNKHPDITESAVIGVPHLLDNNHPMAFILRKSNAKVYKENLIQTFFPIKCLLKNLNKKVDRCLISNKFCVRSQRKIY